MNPNDDFVQKYLEDIRNEMRWRRELEFRLLQFLLVFYPIVATAMVALYQSPISPNVFAIISIGASLIIFPATLFVSNRIVIEHKAYSKLANTVLKIWEYFGLFQIGAYIENGAILDSSLKDPIEGFGKGKGYKRTLSLIWSITIVMVVLILTLGVLKFI